jgi:hypothetical protein
VKLKIITIGIILILALFAGSAAAMTENKNLPTEQEIVDFVKSVNVSGADSLSQASVREHPTWKWDTWDKGEMISFYYTVDSKKGYGSIYFDKYGKEIPALCGKTPVLEKKYAGEEKAPVKDEKKVEIKEEIKKEDVKENITVKPEKEIINEGIKEEEAKDNFDTMSKETKIDIIIKLIRSLAND